MRGNKNRKIWDFDRWANRYDEAVSSDSLLYARYEEVLDKVVKTANISSGKRVLDIGTGTGSLIPRCLARGASVVGLDPSKNMLAKARKKVGPDSKVEFLQVVEPFLNIPYPDASFDAGISTYAFHHIPHFLKGDCVRETVRILKIGGIWVLGDLVFLNEKTEKEALIKYDWLEEEYFTRIEEIRPVFRELGMKLNSQQFTPVSWVLWAIKPNNEIVQLD